MRLFFNLTQMKNQMKTKIKVLTLMPFLTILLAVFTVSFISKSEENLFKEFLKNFTTAKLPLKVAVLDQTFNEKNKIDAKFSAFFSREMQERKYSRMTVTISNEYQQIVAQNENMVAVIVGTSTERGFAMKKSNGNYSKSLVIYDKKGTVLDTKTLAFKYSNAYTSAEIKADLSFSVQKFSSKNADNEKDTKKFTLEKTENFLVTASGKIVNTDEKEQKEEVKKQTKSL